MGIVVIEITNYEQTNFYYVKKKLGFKATVNLPYRGKPHRGKVIKFSSGDKIFSRQKFSPAKIFPDEKFNRTNGFPR